MSPSENVIQKYIPPGIFVLCYSFMVNFGSFDPTEFLKIKNLGNTDIDTGCELKLVVDMHQIKNCLKQNSEGGISLKMSARLTKTNSKSNF